MVLIRQLANSSPKNVIGQDTRTLRIPSYILVQWLAFATASYLISLSASLRFKFDVVDPSYTRICRENPFLAQVKKISCRSAHWLVAKSYCRPDDPIE